MSRPFLFRSKSNTQYLEEDHIGPILEPSPYSATRHRKIYFILAHGEIAMPIRDCIQHQDLIYVLYNELGLVLPSFKLQRINSDSICKTYKPLNSNYTRTNYSILPEHRLKHDEQGSFTAMAGSCQSEFRIMIDRVVYLSEIVEQLITYHESYFRGEPMSIRCFFCSSVQDPNTILQALVWKEEKKAHMELPFLHHHDNSSSIAENNMLLHVMEDCLQSSWVELHNIETQYKVIYLYEMSSYSNSVLKALKLVFYEIDSRINKEILTPEQIVLHQQYHQQIKDFMDAFHLFQYKIGLPYLAGKKYKKSKSKKYKRRTLL
jgi:hypothetical protein